jgi:leucyl-tRNA synthetase
MIAKYGADSLRLFMLFLGPPQAGFEWKDEGLEASWRFLSRVWRAVSGVAERAPAASDGKSDASRKLEVQVARTVKRVTEDIEARLQPNTAIARLMELTTALTEHLSAPSYDPAAAKHAAETLLLLIAPIAPHLAEELWERLGHTGEDRVSTHEWPSYDASLLSAEKIKIALQVNGKLRDTVEIDPDADEDSLRAFALENPKVQSFVKGATPKRVVVVKGRLVNVVV